MPSGCIQEQYGAPRHFSLPPIKNGEVVKKPKVVVGHCDKMNLFYVREPTLRSNKFSDGIAFMK